MILALLKAALEGLLKIMVRLIWLADRRRPVVITPPMSDYGGQAHMGPVVRDMVIHTSDPAPDHTYRTVQAQRQQRAGYERPHP
jgi:hypothetical protein